MQFHKIIIIDFGSQYTQLIARRIRELGVYSLIITPDDSIESDINIKGIILSGGPSSVYDKNSPDISKNILKSNIPILGICYGMQLIAKKMKGNVQRSLKREYGKTVFKHNKKCLLFKHIPERSSVWMSHSDKITKLPPGFNVCGKSVNTRFAAIFNKNKKIYALQFHPEVYHTEYGKDIIKNFLFEICKAQANWTPENFVNEKINEIKNTVKNEKVISGISGGVDSTVATEIVHRAVGNNLKSFLIDTGLLRADEGKQTVKLLKKHLNMHISYVNKSRLFLKQLKSITDPEKKRKIIGNVFIKVFEEQAKKHKKAAYLVQGTIYPDRIESQSTKGPSSLIKSHHNVGGLPKNMKLKLIEPLKELFKDEVRNVGKVLGIPNELLLKHPFPGPGLAVRIIGEINLKRIKILQQADKIYIDTIKKYGIYNDIWQAFAVFLPVKSVGVMGDNRTYENIIALRAVNSIDGMTADWFDFPKHILEEISTRIINEVNGVNRVVYDISTKPPSTIEWE